MSGAGGLQAFFKLLEFRIIGSAGGDSMSGSMSDAESGQRHRV
jgi:hypothetical protein